MGQCKRDSGGRGVETGRLRDGGPGRAGRRVRGGDKGRAAARRAAFSSRGVRIPRGRVTPGTHPVGGAALSSVGVQASGKGVVGRRAAGGNGQGAYHRHQPTACGGEGKRGRNTTQGTAGFSGAPAGQPANTPLSTLETPSPPGSSEGQAPAPSGPHDGACTPGFGSR